MARHTGKDGKVKMGANFVGGLTNWSIDESVETENLSAAEDGWDVNKPKRKNWKGEITLRADHADTAQAALRAGDELAFEGYSEGDASGKTYYSGNIIITNHGIGSPHDGAVERTYSMIGDGALASTAVA